MSSLDDLERMGEKSWPYAEALAIAEAARSKLAPWCERIEIAGSLRRRRPQVKDIELVAIRKEVSADLFQGGTMRPYPEFCAAVDAWEKVKGSPEGLYAQRRLPEGIKLDLFMCTKSNWGLIFAIRTGSAAFSHQVLARGWVDHGYHSEGGMLRKGGMTIETPEEQDLFRYAGVGWVEPEEREV